MAISTYSDPYSARSCGGAECMRRAGDQARKVVDEQTRTVTEAAVRKTMEAEASLKASAAIVQVHIDRIVALELEVARLRADPMGISEAAAKGVDTTGLCSVRSLVEYMHSARGSFAGDRCELFFEHAGARWNVEVAVLRREVVNAPPDESP